MTCVAAWLQTALAADDGARRLSYLASPGAAGSRQVRFAEGLLADTETRVIYAHPASEVEHPRNLLGLSDTGATLLPHLPRGQALWKFQGSQRLSTPRNDGGRSLNDGEGE